MTAETLTAIGCAVLNEPDAREKARKARAAAVAWKEARDAGAPPGFGTEQPPDFPARPQQPALLDPRDMPKPANAEIVSVTYQAPELPPLTVPTPSNQDRARAKNDPREQKISD